MRSGLQFNFIVRSRVQREDGDEYLFGSHTVVVRPDRSFNDELASWAPSGYSKDPLPLPSQAQRLLQNLDALPSETAYQIARGRLEGQLSAWDWEDDVDLIGVAKVVVMAPAA